MNTKLQKLLFNTVHACICMVLLVFSPVTSHAHASDIQNTTTVNVTIKLENATVKQLFSEIEQQTEFTFVYDEKVLNTSRTYTFVYPDKSVSEILDDLKSRENFMFKQINNTITVTRLSSQGRVINGAVRDADGVPLPGATIIVKGTSVGTTSDFDGNFRINMPKGGEVLLISFIGYVTREVAVGDQSFLEITLEEDVSSLEEVVVTALNITREEKSLGYAISKVEGDDLTKTVTGNWMNNMSGKVAGMSFSSAGTGPAGSVRVSLRGDLSLNYGNNSPLFVVDGIPIYDGMTATRSVSNYAQADAPVDYGNGASDINPEDVESVSVLKGPAAAALYGSRAANGAIIITTKSGRKDKGLGVTINSSLTFERAGYFPDFQTEYGNGSDMGMEEFSMWELSADMAPDGVATPRRYSRYTFGEKFDPNKMRYLYASKNWDTNTFTKLPWVYQDDWYTGLFKTGITTNNTVTISGGNGEGTSTRFSFTNYENEWILPNTGFNKRTVSLSFTTPLHDKIKLSTKLNYYNRKSDNMPVGGYDETNPMYSLVWGFNVNSIDEWKKEQFEGRYNYTNWNAQGQNGQGLVFPSANSFNPYRTLYEALNGNDKNRLFGNMSLSFDLMEGLTLDVRSGLDWSNDFRTQQKPFYTAGYQNGFYREQTIRRYEMNTDFMLRYVNNTLVEDRFGLSLMFGGNNMTNKYHNSKTTLDELGEEGVYHTTNLPTGVIPSVYDYHSKKVINSLYGMASLSWDDTYFLDITARNDWSSTLARGNWSYFYPSVAASILTDRIFNFRENAPWVDMLKLRLSWANVGNDTSPYQLDQSYGTTSFPGGSVLTGTIPDPLIQPENVESWEAGLEAKFFKNRVSLDLALYHSSMTDQIITVATDQITGATGRKINAGEIVNKGIEVAATFVPVRTNDFNWSFDLTWSKNINRLVSLQDGWDPDEPYHPGRGTTIGSRVFVYSYLGEEMNVIYGKGFQRAPEGAFYTDENGEQVNASGMHIVNEEGYPLLDTNPDRRIGRVSPDWRGGMVQRFRYKNLSLMAAFSGQWGGNAFSVTNFALSYQGKLKNSLEGRYDGLVHPGVNKIEHSDGTVTYTKNTTVTNSIQTYYNTYVWNRDNVEMNTFDTSFLKLREVRLDYDFPAEICRKTGFLQSASIGAFATNLFTWTDFPQYDPETGMLNGSDIHPGIESMAFPMTRSYGLNVKLSF
ncbi:SusC/RagA family TonB-linked outer membrane protein [Sinomicrobium weinanense]|uniref:SusC/RagA family TonB-linked outer membrane protein n=1 Tax=Sinomicrobium weinanense TaxID=2842200 RepID=A0A926JTC5_9FLAO|nr:SusC/RagA family TonB-linked outer membrane protein [Sinomicrobium weinanense]MBC9796836.1 SusC/RagA family TonB-linked outer membrane protein [Sinomicrobium weinanense]MBU3125209.1 SusC/RagA family TonB-linked outer membrane protein [Sinomicrobium weinanense]